VLFDSVGDPRGVERMGIALEPEADYQLSGNGGGCEDPRISYVESLQHYVMTYTAFSRRGPRIAIAISDDLLHWRRIGLATFHPHRGIAFDGIGDKDASVFSTPIPGVYGQPAIGLVHRPLFPGTRPEEKMRQAASRYTDAHRECIWILHCRVSSEGDEHHRCEFVAHHRLACPVAGWEHLKIGGGTPPTMCRHGWLMLYRGVHEIPRPTPARP
jgi:beta-1,2-mannobiose phosphorylase / 1,2-beta-oligomannan phosphorylase